MQLLIAKDPCLLGPDVLGLHSPDHVWALLPDVEHSGKPSQACSMFEAGAAHADLVVASLDEAVDLFTKLREDLSGLCQSKEFECECAAVMTGLWLLPGNRAVVAAADIDGGFARNSMSKVLCSSSLVPVSRMCFDAKSLKSERGLGEVAKHALEVLTR